MPLLPADVACWLLKTTRPPEVLVPGWAPGEVRRLRRCLRPSYRLGLMVPGGPCLLWLSGRRDPGVHALGTLAAAPDPDGSVEVLLHRLAEPVDRAELVADPAFGTAEVVRMAAGSNPSYLRPAELAAVLARLGPAAPAGWATGQSVARSWRTA